MKALSNIDAIYKQFPFLESHSSRAVVKKANVLRWVNESINNYYPTAFGREVGLLPNSKYPDCSDAATKIKLHLLSEHGEILYVVGENSRENIGQALHRLGIRRRYDVCYGLERIYYRKKKGFFKREHWIVAPEVFTIIKLPKGIANGQEWIESIANESLEAIQNL